MKIVYNLASLAPPKTGIGHYTDHLIRGVLAHPEIEDVVGRQRERVLTRADLVRETNTSSPACTSSLIKQLRTSLRKVPGIYRCRALLEDWRSQSLLKKYAQQGYIYHETNFIPASYPGKVISTIHDLSHIRYPEHHPKERVKYLNWALPKAFQRADKIIAVSEFSRQEILDYFKLDPSKVVTVLNGVSEQFFPRQAAELKTVLDKYSVRYRGYVLSVCTLEPRKNLARLLEAFSLLPTELRKAYPMVLAGAKGWQIRKVLNTAEALLSAGELMITGYVSQKELVGLYSGAAIFAYPSLYEGFGLPVLEAMASGVPVVTSNVSSLPEVAGDAALMVDPFSVDSISKALLRLLEDKALAAQCISKGLARAQALSWNRCVENTIAVYRSVAFPTEESSARPDGKNAR